jgi:hypothetical protein
MRFTLLAGFLAMMSVGVVAVAPMNSYIISFPKEAPRELVQKAMDKVVKAKGVVTHEYSKSPQVLSCFVAACWVG